ncbi:hypothetical protein THAOC_19079 [Thalassiosira oceanica]|uniref:Uncharacterized protein n=1 Tax=Thalassiosira oceanica TaxID=159749 RepID=K0S5J2_THAOC|nr:hypothetical protein THAOC_19079 [Thalassiosira oceanica]|eukprot:EJK60545.1 hypothetical protein THAOC_19079 [Thalassiosira oceanica]
MPRPDATAHPAIVAATSPCFSISSISGGSDESESERAGRLPGRIASPSRSSIDERLAELERGDDHGKLPFVRFRQPGRRLARDDARRRGMTSPGERDARSRAGRPGKFSAAALEGQVLARVGVCRRRGPGTPLGLDCVRHGPRFRRLNEGRRTGSVSSIKQTRRPRHTARRSR